MERPRGSEGYRGQYGWGQSHPLVLGSVKEYIDAAHERRAPFKEIVTTLAASMGPSLHVIEPFVKDQESAERKLCDRTSSNFNDPTKIGDYLRGRIYVPARPSSIAQINDAIDMMLDHPLTVGHKDTHWIPKRETGWRCTMAAVEVDGLRCELQIVALNPRIQSASKLSEDLRSVERATRYGEERLHEICNLQDNKSARTYSRLVTQAESTLSDIRALRKSVHDFAFASVGLDVLADPKALKHHKPPTPAELKSMFREAGKGYFGGSIKTRYAETVQGLINSPLAFH